MKKSVFMLLISLTILSCGNNSSVQIGENTFIRDEKVFRIIDNQITELGTIDNDSIAKSKVLNPKIKNYGKNDISYVKEGAYSELKAVYRGNVLYFKLSIEEFNDLKVNNSVGGFTLNFLDEFDFTIHSSTIPLHELVSIVDSNGQTTKFEYNGQTEMSTEVNKAIKSYSLSSSVR